MTSENKYFINCDPENYESTCSLLNEKIHKIISKMNNHDGSFDFIITCSENVFNELKDNNIKILADKKLDYVTSNNII